LVSADDLKQEEEEKNDSELDEYLEDLEEEHEVKNNLKIPLDVQGNAEDTESQDLGVDPGSLHSESDEE